MLKYFNDSRDLFFKMRFGMFVHWGLYAIPSWHEQVLWRSDYNRRDYEKLKEQFNPVKFNPEEWLDTLQEAGMQYLCFTSKHHDGFCMFDTKYTDYKITNTPYGKDVLALLAEACHRRGIAFSIYYSIPDWHHPNYPNLGRHHEMFGPRSGDQPDMAKYCEYVVNQIKELMTNYGKIYQLFWDVNVLEWLDPSVNEMVRSLQPGILINDRGPGTGDYSTPERNVPDTRVFEKPTEACQACGRESWGYRSNEDYYSDRYLMQSIDRTLSMGGNYLLNVGPKPDGTLPEENVATLRKIGKWYRSIRESFDTAVPASWVAWDDKNTIADTVTVRDRFLATRKGNTLYIHLPFDPQSTGVILRPIEQKPVRVTLLNDGRQLPFNVEVTPWAWKERPWLHVYNLPVNEMTDSVMVLKLEFDESVSE